MLSQTPTSVRPLIPCKPAYGFITRQAKWALLNADFHREVKDEIQSQQPPIPKLTLDMEGYPVQCIINGDTVWVIQVPGCKHRTYVAYPTFRDYQCNTNAMYVTVEQLLPMMEAAVACQLCPTCGHSLVKRLDGFYGCSEYSLIEDYNVCTTKISTPAMILDARVKNYCPILRKCFSGLDNDYTQAELVDATKSSLSVNMSEFDRVWGVFCENTLEDNWRTKRQRRMQFTQWITFMNKEQMSLFPSEQLELFEKIRLQNSEQKKAQKRKRSSPENEISDATEDIE